jgi:hypothetical protein
MAKKKSINLNKVKIEASNYGDLKGVEIFLTDDLYNEIANKSDKQNVPILTKLKNGKFMRGMKHLITDIKAPDKNNNLILTKGNTRKEDKNYFINYNDYQAKGQSRFLGMYREAGFEVAGGYLNQYFPSDFENPKEKVNKTELRKVENEFSEVVKQLSKKAKNKKVILQETSNLLETLRNEKYELKRDVEILKELKEKSNIYYYQTQLKELSDRLTGDKKYNETSGKNSWQSWIYYNNWIFGITYRPPIEKAQVGFNQIPDYLFPTLDGFIDILEIKLPNKPVILKDESHSGSFRWSGETNEAIGQVVNYLHELEIHQLEIKQKLERTYCKQYKIEIFSIKPRAYIVIGTKTDWDENQKEALRKLNYSLHGIEVLTYSDLQLRGENIMKLYVDEDED